MDIHSDKWAGRFLRQAYGVASWSKDPSTKVGAYVVTKEGAPVSHGYNGLPQDVEDLPERYERPLKYKYMCHAESNAIDLAPTKNFSGCTMFITHFPCAGCAGRIIQNKFECVVVDKKLLNDPDFEKRWGEDFKISTQIFKEAGIKVLIKDAEYYEK